MSPFQRRALAETALQSLQSGTATWFLCLGDFKRPRFSNNGVTCYGADSNRSSWRSQSCRAGFRRRNSEASGRKPVRSQREIMESLKAKQKAMEQHEAEQR